VHLGHNFNWEFAQLAFVLHAKQPFLGVYMPLENKVLDRIFIRLRSRFGTILLPATDMRHAILPWRNRKYILGLVADQSPGIPSRSFWVHFFNQPTSFVTGPENGARLNNLAVVFCHLTKQRRGYYDVHFELAEENPASLPIGELTQRYVGFLEKTIREHPDMWLWSHRRWKHPWKEEYGPVLNPLYGDKKNRMSGLN
jgi:KDO2-lipid IV(A) lauroyltransferase